MKKIISMLVLMMSLQSANVFADIKRGPDIFDYQAKNKPNYKMLIGDSYYSTPRFGGGYNYYGNGWSAYSTPRFGGGYNYYDNKGGSGYSTPRFGGGYNYYFKK